MNPLCEKFCDGRFGLARVDLRGASLRDGDGTVGVSENDSFRSSSEDECKYISRDNVDPSPLGLSGMSEVGVCDSMSSNSVSVNVFSILDSNS